MTSWRGNLSAQQTRGAVICIELTLELRVIKMPWRWREVTEMMSQSPQTVLRHLLQWESHGKHKIWNVIHLYIASHYD